MIMTFNDFINKYGLKKEATSIIEIQQILSPLSLKDVGIYLRDGPFKTDMRILILHPSKGTIWVAYINENYFESSGCAPPNKIFRPILIGNGCCSYSEYKIQNLDSPCAAFCSYIIYLTKVVAIDFKSSVLN